MAGSPYIDLDRPPLREAELQQALIVPGGVWTRLTVVPQTGSTNADAVVAGVSGADEGLVILAEHQTAGRGRLDRNWRSPARAGVALSVLLRPGIPARGWPAVPSDRYGWLPLLAGVALAEAIRRVSDVNAAVKWPNDVMIGDRKCAGILAEVCPSSDPVVGILGVVIGIGLNTTLRADELPHPMATSLALSGAAVSDRGLLVRALLRAIADWYIRWRAVAGDADACGLKQAYEECCTTLGTDVRVLLPSVEAGILEGTAEGVDHDGRLIVLTADGQRTVLAAGDVTHVRVPASDISRNRRRLA